MADDLVVREWGRNVSLYVPTIYCNEHSALARAFLALDALVGEMAQEMNRAQWEGMKSTSERWDALLARAKEIRGG